MSTTQGERSPFGRNIDVTVVFSHGVGLQTWAEAGILDREASYYRDLATRVGSVTFITYDRGGESFEELVRQVEPIRVLWNDTKLPYQLFGLLAPVRHFKAFRRSDVIRTNQFSGAWVGVLAKWLARRPLIVRGGFVRSQFMDRQESVGRLRRGLARMLEGFSLRRADGVVVTTPADRDFIAERHGLDAGQIQIVPNPIDTDAFKPGTADEQEPGLVLTVGRLAPQKNLPALLEAMKAASSARLQVAGAGAGEEEARAMAGSNVEFLGRVPNSDLPGLHRRSQVFALASHYEGSPKALLEAMASGMAVVGADSPGIREVIDNDVNGLLVAGEADALAAAITRLLGDEELRTRLGAAAREYVMATNTQAASIALENELLARLVGA